MSGPQTRIGTAAHCGGWGRTLVPLAALVLVGLAALGQRQASAGFAGSDYVARGTCGPFPRAQVRTPTWACVGLVAGPKHGLRWPRSILAVGRGRFVITDMVGWRARQRGRIHLLDAGADGRVRTRLLFRDRNIPHGLAMGPDGWIYVGDEDRIWRFHLDAPAETARTVIAGLPAKMTPSQRFANVPDNWHPLSHIAFDLNGSLLVNVGAPRDNCILEGRGGFRYPSPCPWVTGDAPQAAVWELAFTWPEDGPGQPGAFRPLSRGLRNSMALAIHPRSGLILQAENNIDIWGGKSRPEMPPEEINILERGAHYGWPYCAGAGTVVPAYRYRGVTDCSEYRHPEVLMPSHAAPIGMTYYFGAMFPRLRGKLIVALHGFRKWGQRIVAYDTAADGRPLAPPDRQGGLPGLPLAVVDGWQRRPGARPRGRPVGFAVDEDGAIWFVDDKAKTVMVILRDAAAPEQTVQSGGGTPLPAIGQPPEGWEMLYNSVLQRRCASCHAAFRQAEPKKAWHDLALTGFVGPGPLAQTPLVRRMLGHGAGRPMPLAGGLKAFPEELALLRRLLERLDR